MVDFFIGFVAGIRPSPPRYWAASARCPVPCSGLIIRLIEAFWAAYLSPECKDVATFAIPHPSFSCSARPVCSVAPSGKSVSAIGLAHADARQRFRTRPGPPSWCSCSASRCSYDHRRQGGKLVVLTRWPCAGAVAIAFAISRIAFRWLGERWRAGQQRRYATAETARPDGRSPPHPLARHRRLAAAGRLGLPADRLFRQPLRCRQR